MHYIGIDSPESGQPCSEEATAANAALIEDQTVTLVSDVSPVDQFGRLLRYVYVGDTFVNAEMIAQGYALAVAYHPDVAHADEFEELEALAQEEDLGCHPTGAFEAIAAASGEEGLTTASPPPPNQTPLPAATVTVAPTSAPASTQPPPPTQPAPPTSQPAVCNCSGNVYNCADFSSHSSAQACFGYCYSLRGFDVHQLDGDNDGVACESLP